MALEQARLGRIALPAICITAALLWAPAQGLESTTKPGPDDRIVVLLRREKAPADRLEVHSDGKGAYQVEYFKDHDKLMSGKITAEVFRSQVLFLENDLNSLRKRVRASQECVLGSIDFQAQPMKPFKGNLCGDAKGGITESALASRVMARFIHTLPSKNAGGK